MTATDMKNRNEVAHASSGATYVLSTTTGHHTSAGSFYKIMHP